MRSGFSRLPWNSTARAKDLDESRLGFAEGSDIPLSADDLSRMTLRLGLNVVTSGGDTAESRGNFNRCARPADRCQAKGPQHRGPAMGSMDADLFQHRGFLGMYAFARVTQSIGRRPTFAIFFTIAMAATALAFGSWKRCLAIFGWSP